MRRLGRWLLIIFGLFLAIIVLLYLYVGWWLILT